ncbi:aspartyl-phosphate phosphatase Spo0E family protein [Sediminibacillus massiliensis]|uniref:aspartyl-phosphate phosphatase Spo0E family protein n=1 Tax=Sediminibacillus massiliensis TaxID=1926277 RepID=UPI00098884A9|nr:aspartyl-phosphate phosphatase Spo0E family protein [Sediminibacillus massiliensis]
MDKLTALERKVEELRQKMYQASLKNPESTEVLKISQTLDETLNQFEQIKIQVKKLD